VIERLMIMVPGDTVTSSDLSFFDGGFVPADLGSGPPMSLHDARELFEREYILRALSAQQGNISRTADALGVERSNLCRRASRRERKSRRKDDGEGEP
jgi:two-component system nitrogen regulation response regulator NtrX